MKQYDICAWGGESIIGEWSPFWLVLFVENGRLYEFYLARK